jgi:hypothetical protein
MLKLSSHVTVNAVVWIHSLPPEEKGFTDRAIDDLQPFLLATGVQFQSFEPATAADLQDYLTQITRQAAQGLRPIIHFDTHGSATDGIYIAGSRQYVSWSQLIAWLRPINIQTQNNLSIVSAACCSMNIYKGISVEEQCPFFVIIAPGDPVSFGFIENNMIRFYEEVFNSLDIVAAYNKYLKEKLSLIHCERALVIALGRYIRDHCVGVGSKIRRERLVTETLAARRFPNNPTTRRLIRKEVKRMIRPTQALVDRYVKSFLIGRTVAFGLPDIMKEARESIAREQRLSVRKAKSKPSR